MSVSRLKSKVRCSKNGRALEQFWLFLLVMRFHSKMGWQERHQWVGWRGSGSDATPIAKMTLTTASGE